jgi:hypothetical protein
LVKSGSTFIGGIGRRVKGLFIGFFMLIPMGFSEV